ncbi:TIGR03936 family radical SAM-associated protein [Orenia marismortui]|uniref:TIGR03936 family radical SAM-associated protein n=1 Tax=Orenia marismortui TaxID=46469 RepID=UPI00036B7AE3|nr:TIGR03936 family radical SAM-associated protein [Orenia marismortui]
MSNKIRAKVLKGDQVRFISHLDFMTTINRAVRRAKIAIAFSQGYNPKPNVSFASALAVGLTSDSEYIDFELEKDIDIREFQETLNNALPEGIKIIRVAKIDSREKSLTSQINRANYLARLELNKVLSIDDLRGKIIEFLSQDKIMIRRKRRRKKDRVFDIKPLIYNLEVVGVQYDLATINMLVQTGSSGNLRPEEVINALADYFNFIAPAKLINIHRSGLYIKVGEEILTPIEAVVKGN